MSVPRVVRATIAATPTSAAISAYSIMVTPACLLSFLIAVSLMKRGNFLVAETTFDAPGLTHPPVAPKRFLSGWRGVTDVMQMFRKL